MHIEIARDRKTGFPAIRREGTTHFIGLFPVTKLQVEQWIWSGGIQDEEILNGLSDLIDRLELHSVARYPAPVEVVSRRKIQAVTSETMVGVVATNLKLWANDNELHEIRGAVFPTPASEAGRLVRWLKGSVPDKISLVRLHQEFSRISTAALLHAVLNLNFTWDEAVRDLLMRISKLMPQSSRGLPFTACGLFEVTSTPEEVNRIHTSPKGPEVRPQAIGTGAIWPMISEERVKGIRQPAVPVVDIRLLYREDQLDGRSESHKFRSIDIVDERMNEVAKPETNSVVRRQTPWKVLLRLKSASRNPTRQLQDYVRAPRKLMDGICPFCHSAVEKEVFTTGGTFFCYLERQAANNPDGKPIDVRRHSASPPPGHPDEASRAYLDVAQNTPGVIHIVGLFGFSRVGKTIWLLSLGGQMDYPDADSTFSRLFPERWKFLKEPCNIYNSKDGIPDKTNRKAETERLWLDGRAPVRTEKGEQGIREQLLLNSSPNGSKERMLAILKDFSGEEMHQRFGANPNYPHIPWTTDALMMLSAKEIFEHELDTFLLRLRNTTRNESAVDLKKVNLILMITKIDELLYATQEKRELLERIVSQPYSIPSNRNLEDMKQYFEGMTEVHFGIRDWFYKYKRDMQQKMEEVFGSVRYCAISAIGFEPMPGEGLQSEIVLPFRPEPIRAIDPILWLMNANGLAAF